MSTLPAVRREELVAAKFAFGTALNSMLTPGYFFMKAALTARKPASEASELDTMNFRVPVGAPPAAAEPPEPDEQAARRAAVASTETALTARR
jgi:hypothetical protein